MSKYKKYAFRGLVVGAFIAIAASVGGFVTNNKPLQASGTRDCNDNAVIYGGVMDMTELQTSYINGHGNDCGADVVHNDYGTIYNAFGITPAGINSLKTTSAMGQVKRDGTVWLNNVQIADGAMTAGRINMAGSTPVAGTSVFMRSPSVSFVQDSLDAYIGFENGKPAWAILGACGNPVKWNKPHTTITKQVAKQDLSGFVKDATYTNNSEVRYMLTVKNDGNATDTNVAIVDKLPEFQTYVAGSTKINDVPTADGITTNGLGLATLAPGQSVDFNFRAKLAIPATKCGVTDLTNIGHANSDKSGTTEDSARTHTTIICDTPKPPVVTTACVSLTGPDSILVTDTATYTATASANGTTVFGYNFYVNGVQYQDSPSNTTKVVGLVAGTKTIKVVVTFTNGTTAESAACAKAVTVKEVPKPTYICDVLNVNPTTVLVNDTVNASAGYTVTNGATFKSATFNFGEGAPVVVTDANNVKASYKYTTAGDKNVTVDFDFTVNGQTVTVKGTGNCAKKVTVKEKPVIATNCDALTATKGALLVGETTTLTATATAMNTTVSEVIFKVNGQVIQSGSTKMTYDFKPTSKGDYNVTVSVKFANGDVKGGDAACAKTVTVTEKETPIYTCDAFSVTPAAAKIGDNVTVTVKYTATGGATFDHAVVDYNETTVNVTKDQAANGTFTTTYAYKAAKEYAVKATLTFMVNGQPVVLNSSTCAGKVTITTTPVCEYNPNLPKDSKDCKPPVEKCKIPGKEKYEANDKVNCAAVLPDTGAGSMVGLFASVTVAGAFLHNVLARRSAGRQ